MEIFGKGKKAAENNLSSLESNGGSVILIKRYIYKFWIELSSVQAVDPVEFVEVDCVVRAEAIIKKAAVAYPRIAVMEVLFFSVVIRVFDVILVSNTVLVKSKRKTLLGS